MPNIGSTDTIQPNISIADFSRKSPGFNGRPLKLATVVDPATNVHTLVVSASVAAPVGGATEAKQDAQIAQLGSIDGKLPPLLAGDVAPNDQLEAVVVAQRSMVTWRTSFALAVAGGLDPEYFGLVGAIGTGHTVNQTGGNLVIAAGTTANSELIARSVRSFTGSFVLRFGTLHSQRIINNNFVVELVDVLGEGLVFTINSATSITVTFPTTNPFAAGNIGQSVSIGALTGAAGTIPGRYAIASVAGLTVNLTVAGFPASGSGTLYMYGWNHYRTLYTGLTATLANFNTQRRGYQNPGVDVTINTSLTPGHLVQVNTYSGVSAKIFDRLRASATLVTYAQRGAWEENLPENNTRLFVQIRSTNGSVAPASSTTWTVNFVSVEDTAATSVLIEEIMPQGPIQVGGAVTVGGTVALSGTQIVQGSAAHDAPVGTNQPFLAAAEARTTNPAVVSASADIVRAIATMIGVPITRPFSIPESDWQMTPVTLINTTSTALRAAAGAGIKNYLTHLTYQNTNATPTVINILRGATIIYTFSAAASMPNPLQLTWTGNPLQSLANEALNIQCVTTGANVLVSAGGHFAP